jgi:hypothetical protein
MMLGGSTTLPATVTLFETEPLTKVIVLLLVPSEATPVRRTKIEVGATPPPALVPKVKVSTNGELVLVEIWKFEPGTLTVMFVVRFVPLAAKKFVPIPGLP